MRTTILYAAYGWMLVMGVLHFGVDVMSQYVRGKRLPGPATTLYYGLNTSYALGQVAFAAMAFFALRHGLTAVGSWGGLLIGLGAAAGWLAVSFLFIEYPQPRFAAGVFVLLLVVAAASPR